jgi:hypothetical protein
MAATTSRISALWVAFLNLLVTCISGLGFAAPARLRAAASAAPALPAVPPVPAVAPTVPAGRPAAGPPPQAPPLRAGLPAVPAQGASGRGRTAAVPAQATASPEPGAGAGGPGRRRSAAQDRPAASAARTFVPAPRPYGRERSLPPTMKQRIGAEAHGTSPSARSADVPFDLTLGPLASAAAAGRGEARIPAARRRDRALCG